MAMNRIFSEHPIYKTMKPRWLFYSDSYKGGYSYKNPSVNTYNNNATSTYLFQHELEDLIPKKFSERDKRAYYINLCRLPVNTYSKYIFNNRQPIERTLRSVDGKSLDVSMYEPYIDNIDMRGNNIDGFMKEIAINSWITGVHYILVNVLPSDEEVITRRDELEKGIRAYALSLSALDVIDWSINPITNDYNWVKIKKLIYDDSDWSQPRTESTNVIIIDREMFYEFDRDGMLIEEKPNPLGIVPLIRVLYSDIDKDGMPESMLSDIAPLNRELYNACSLYQEELYKIAFSQLAMQIPAEASQDDVDRIKEYARGVDLILPYTQDTEKPEFITPSVAALSEKREYINFLIMEILRSSGLNKQDGIEGANYLSGIAMAFSYNDTYYSVSNMATKLQAYEQQLWDYIYLWDNNTLSDTITTIYPTDFDILSDKEKIENAILVKDSIDKCLHAHYLSDVQIIQSALKPNTDDLDIIESELDESYKALDSLEKEKNSELEMLLKTATIKDLPVEDEDEDDEDSESEKGSIEETKKLNNLSLRYVKD